LSSGPTEGRLAVDGLAGEKVAGLMVVWPAGRSLDWGSNQRRRRVSRLVLGRCVWAKPKEEGEAPVMRKEKSRLNIEQAKK